MGEMRNRINLRLRDLLARPRARNENVTVVCEGSFDRRPCAFGLFGRLREASILKDSVLS